MSGNGQAPARNPGLRERKKARTRADLQRHALRLFRDRGWEATTVDDIAAAAEVSRSTFFRYFATKEQVLLHDEVDPLMAEAIAAQPPGTPLLTALRRGVHEAFSSLSDEARELEEVRMELGRTVPELATAAGRHYTVAGLAEPLAHWLGRSPDDPELVVFCGVLVGGRLAAQRMAERDGIAYIDALDSVYSRLEDGIPLADTPIPAGGS
ncbi:TetR family transcriptional regulator [Pseudonocardia phyllosphaerae]|uniref:TetR family transcriptional regulator n=1 Tax=Pseudonocardia phyllosphaerae TaxID=3390502 RepID=UPI00397A12FA